MRYRFVAVAVAAVVALTGCSAGGGDKSGGSGQPRVLVLANPDGENLAGAPAVQRFVDRVAELSDGKLTVEVKSPWRAIGDEIAVIKDVGAGKADLGYAGTRAFDMVGVNDFQPLHAPFLVSSYAAQAAVVADPLVRELLDGLKPLGVTGLALAADQLRFPAGVAGPVLAPEDFTGRVFRTYPSKVQSDALRALGAQPTSETIGALAASGRLGGFETMWWTYQVNGYYGTAPYVTPNAVLWPRTVAIFASDRTVNQLDDQAQDWINHAAADAATWSTTHAGEAEAEQMKQSCKSGARIALASDGQLTALRQATEPVYAAIRADRKLGAILTRVEALARGAARPAAVAVPEGCAYRPGESPVMPPRTLTGPGEPGGLPQGVYRYTLTEAELRAVGYNAHDARNNAGVWTWTLRAGSWTMRHEPAHAEVMVYSSCDGWYEVRGETVTFDATTHEGRCVPPDWTARWSATGDGITWSEVSVPDFAPPFATKPWQTIGN